MKNAAATRAAQPARTPPPTTALTDAPPQPEAPLPGRPPPPSPTEKVQSPEWNQTHHPPCAPDHAQTQSPDCNTETPWHNSPQKPTREMSSSAPPSQIQARPASNQPPAQPSSSTTWPSEIATAPEPRSITPAAQNQCGTTHPTILPAALLSTPPSTHHVAAYPPSGLTAPTRCRHSPS